MEQYRHQKPHTRHAPIDLALEFTFYFFLCVPICARLLYDLSGLNIVPIVYFIGMALGLAALVNGRTPGHKFGRYFGLIFLIVIAHVTLLVANRSGDPANILKLLGGTGAAYYFIRCQPGLLRGFALGYAIVISLVYQITQMLSPGIGFSYHDLGLSIIIAWVLVLLKNRDVSLFYNLLFFCLVVAAQGRTQIFIGAFLLLTTTIRSLESNSRLPAMLLLMALLSGITAVVVAPDVVLPLLSGVGFLSDILERGVSLRMETNRTDGFRIFIWNCYYVTFDYYHFIWGQNPNLDACVAKIWDWGFGVEMIQYENSFIRLNQSAGWGALVMLGLFIWGLLRIFAKGSFIFFTLLLMVTIRASTGDIFFYYYSDFFVFVILYLAVFGFKTRANVLGYSG